MKKTNTLIVLMLVVSACTIDGESVEGSGTVITENRKVGEFDRISVEGFGSITVEVGPAVSLKVEAEDNVLPHLVTEVRGSTLVFTSDVSFTSVREPRYTLTMPELLGVSITGSGDVVATGLATGALDVSIEGSGDVAMFGTAGGLEVSISGSGGLNGEELVVEDAGVRIEGSGSVVVNATGTLDVRITGSGEVTYLGNPTLSQSIEGSGSVSRG